MPGAMYRYMLTAVFFPFKNYKPAWKKRGVKKKWVSALSSAKAMFTIGHMSMTVKPPRDVMRKILPTKKQPRCVQNSEPFVTHTWRNMAGSYLYSIPGYKFLNIWKYYRSLSGESLKFCWMKALSVLEFPRNKYLDWRTDFVCHKNLPTLVENIFR